MLVGAQFRAVTGQMVNVQCTAMPLELAAGGLKAGKKMAVNGEKISASIVFQFRSDAHHLAGVERLRILCGTFNPPQAH